MTDKQFRIHWLAFTVHAPNEDGFTLYNLLFKDAFGELESTGHGGRGFNEIYHGLLEIKLYLNPSIGEKQYFSFEIPGQACDMIDWTIFQALGQLLEGNHQDQYKYTRIDLAFDHVPFTPQQVEQAIRDNQLRSLAKRETLNVHASPFALQDNGEIGTYTTELGSRTSERMIRVYNKRGFTRLELETKEKRANVIAKQLFRCSDISQWLPLMMSHLNDYVEFHPAWWQEFIQGTWRAWEVVTTPKVVTEAKLIHWIDQQISPALSVAVDILPDYAIKAILDRGRIRRGSKYDLLLNAHKVGE